MKPGEGTAGASASVAPSTAVQESRGPEGHSGVQESGGPEEDSGVREREQPPVSGAPPLQATGSSTTAPSSNIPIPTIIIKLILSTMHPTQNVPIGDLADKLRSLASTAKDDLTVRTLASLADSMPKLAALTTNFAANPSSM